MWSGISNLAISLALCTLLGDGVLSYRPVIMMHGLTGVPESMDLLKERILNLHPGTPVHIIDAYNSGDSFKPMWEQVHGVYSIIAPILDSSPEGAILIGFSQGGVIFRGILEAYPTHNITFIALASPMAGQYGELVTKDVFPIITKEFVYNYCYLNENGQRLSICNWWKDPTKLRLYREHSIFLHPLESPTNKEYKSNFEKLENLVLVGGPQDGLVEPWQSSHFGFYDKNMKMIDCVDQEFYVKNSFGLQTLDDSGRLHIYTVPNVSHSDFRKDQGVFDCCIQQWLD